MAKQKVTEKILADAKKEAQEIIGKYRAEALQIKKTNDAQIAIQKTQIENETEAAKKIEYLRRVSQRRLELNRKLVAEKRKIVDSVIDEALIEMTSHKDYLSFLKALISKSGRKDGELMVSKADWKRYGSDLEDFLKDQGCKFTVTINDKISGGIMIKKDKMVYYGSLNIIRELISDQLTIAVSKKLG